MAEEVGFRIVNARQFRAAMKKAGLSLEDLKEANAKVASIVAAATEVRVPRRSGRLASTVRGNRATGRARVSVGGATAPYAGPVHWGWPERGIEENPFVLEAADATEAVWLGAYQDAIEDIIEDIEGAI